jgi:hypothetical protein
MSRNSVRALGETLASKTGGKSESAALPSNLGLSARVCFEMQSTRWRSEFDAGGNDSIRTGEGGKSESAARHTSNLRHAARVYYPYPGSVAVRAIIFVYLLSEAGR